MKTLLLCGLMIISLLTTSFYNGKAKEYPTVVTDPLLRQTQKGSEPYDVTYEKNGVRYKITYKGSGNVSALLRYYEENELSPFIISRVKEKYPNVKIFGVTELTTAAGLTYDIVLESEKKWKIVRARDNGELVQVQSFNKAAR